MGEVLSQYPSRSKPGQVYEIIRGRDGVTYCSCWQWKLNKNCRHLEDFLATMGNVYKPVFRKNTGDTKPTLYLELQEAIEKAVQELK